MCIFFNLGIFVFFVIQPNIFSAHNLACLSRSFEGTFLEQIGHSLKLAFGVTGLGVLLPPLFLPPPRPLLPLAPAPLVPSQVEQCSMRSRVLEKDLEQSGHSPPLLLTLFLVGGLDFAGGASGILSSPLSVSMILLFL